MRAATTVTMLRGLDAFADLTDDDLLVLADRARMEWVPPKTVLFHEGETDPWMFCLVEGSLVLTAADGRVHEITAGSAQAARPIARLKPRRYTARTLTPSRVVRIDASQLGDWAGASDGLSPDSVLVEEVDEPWPGQGAPGFEIEEIPEVVAEAATPAHLGHVAHLESGAIDLPSLPSIAMEARRIIDRDDTGVRTLAKVVLNDPAIAAKLIRVANSAVFHGKGTIESCERAITRLGLKTTRQLVVGFAMRELFKCDVPELQAEMVELWEHSAEVAAIAYVLARRLRIADPDEAQLAWLLHRYRAVPVLARDCP
ncbi:MAG: HDOD domain-containing protein [Chromatiales bacterium]|nr:HDOD domain-containing protein [Chromatiales bacterium]